MLTIPFLTEISAPDIRRVLVAGAGGGFDFMSGLPLCLHLRELGKAVHIANLTFSELDPRAEEWIVPGVLARVSAESEALSSYFPERYFCEWVHARGVDLPSEVYCFQRTGCSRTGAAFERLAELLRPDAVIVVDGGTDSLMRGDEEGLGTPVEDMTTIASVDALSSVPEQRKYLVCLGFGVDTYHGVCHAHVLESVAELIRAQGHLGTFSLQGGCAETQRFADALAFIHERMPGRESIVCSSIQSAFEGDFGDVHRTRRTKSSRLFINPLMSLYWCFRLASAARRILYLHELRQTASYEESWELIRGFHAKRRRRKWQNLPM